MQILPEEAGVRYDHFEGMWCPSYVVQLNLYLWAGRINAASVPSAVSMLVWLMCVTFRWQDFVSEAEPAQSRSILAETGSKLSFERVLEPIALLYQHSAMDSLVPGIYSLAVAMALDKVQALHKHMFNGNIPKRQEQH